MPTIQQQTNDAEKGRLIEAMLKDGKSQKEIAEGLGIAPAKLSTSKDAWLNAHKLAVACEHNENLQRDLHGAVVQLGQFKAQINELQEKGQTANVATKQLQQAQAELQTVQKNYNELQNSYNELQVEHNRLQLVVTNASGVQNELQQTQTELQQVMIIAEQTSADLQQVTKSRSEIAVELQRVTTELEQTQNELQRVVKPNKYRWAATVAYLSVAILAFESYNGYILFCNMIAKQVPETIAYPFAGCFAVTSVTVILFRHSWGIWLCLCSAAISGVIHSGGFYNLDLERIFYVTLPVLCVWVFSDMLNEKINQ